MYIMELTDLASQIIEIIWKYSEEDRIPMLERVFQTQLGGYGYGDLIAGARFPILREIAKMYHKIATFQDIIVLLQDELHEARFVALVLLIYKFKKQPADVFDIYLKNTKFINNWDLVDISAAHIVGKYCYGIQNSAPIWELAKSNDLWENRISVVASWAFVKNNDLDLTIQLCKYFAGHQHHLINKACGWMLREVGKKDSKVLIDFLQRYKDKLPKVTVNYANELFKNKA